MISEKVFLDELTLYSFNKNHKSSPYNLSAIFQSSEAIHFVCRLKFHSLFTGIFSFSELFPSRTRIRELNSQIGSI